MQTDCRAAECLEAACCKQVAHKLCCLRLSRDTTKEKKGMAIRLSPLPFLHGFEGSQGTDCHQVENK